MLNNVSTFLCLLDNKKSLINIFKFLFFNFLYSLYLFFKFNEIDSLSSN